MSKITRRTALRRGGQAIAGVAVLPVISNIAADAAEGDFDGMTKITSRDIQELIDNAARPKASGIVELPAGVIELDASLELKLGVQLIGQGAHWAGDRPGTTFVPAPGFVGPLVTTIKASTPIWHNGALRNLQVRNGGSHGIEIFRMGENATIDNVAAYRNAGDGILITGPGTPVQIGRISVGGNGGAGLRLRGQGYTQVQVQYISGDNNGESMLTIEGGNKTANIQILAWKSERWGAEPGNPDAIRLHNFNGGVADLGQGRVHVGANIPNSPGSLIRQTADAGDSVGYISALVTFFTVSGTYANGYLDEKNGIAIPIADLTRTQFSTIKPWFWSPLEAQVRLGKEVFWKSGSVPPEGSVTAGSGSLYSRTNGELYFKETGSGNTGWRRVEMSV